MVYDSAIYSKEATKTGIFGFVGSTLVLWKYKCQGAIASSTYAVKFTTLRTPAEETVSLRCICYVVWDISLQPTANTLRFFSDSLDVILRAKNS